MAMNGNWYTARKQYNAKRTNLKRKTRVYYLFQGNRTPIPTAQTTKESADAWARAYLRGDRTAQADIVRQQMRSLTDHVADFEESRSEGGSSEWNQTLVARIRQLTVWCGWLTLIDLNAARLKKVLHRCDMSVRTRSHYIQAAKQFGNWLVANDRIESNPFLQRARTGKLILVGRMPRESEKKRRRRYLPVADLRRLIKTVKSGPTLQGVSGRDRAMAIRLAVTTGLRRNELGSVTRQSFDFAGNPPTVYVFPDSTKNREGAELPLRNDLVPELQRWLDGKAGDAPVFGIFGKRTAEMLRADYARCDPPIPYVDKRGRVADWHALRATFASRLILAGNPLVTVQKLMRHSTPELTANLYAQLGLEDLGEAVEALPRI